MSEKPTQYELLSLTAQIVSAQITHHDIDAQALPELIQNVFSTLSGLSMRDTRQSLLSKRPDPYVPIDQSVTDDYIVCLEDGRKLQMLKRHIKKSFNLTVEQYKERWELPSDYPIVAPNYAKRRSEIAKTSGLGNTSKKKRNNLSVVEDNADNVSQVA